MLRNFIQHYYELLLVENENVINFWYLVWGKEYKIGRDLTNDIVIYETTISKFHFILKMDEKEVPYLTDLNSKNGTQINDKYLIPNTKNILNDLDKIKIGENSIYLLFKKTNKINSFKNDQIIGSRFKFMPSIGIFNFSENKLTGKKSKKGKISIGLTFKESLEIIRGRKIV